MSTMQEVQVVHELLKSHHSHVVRTVGHTTNTVMKAAEEATKASKQLQLAVLEVNDNIIAADKDSQSAIAKLTEYQATVNTKLTGILETMEVRTKKNAKNPEVKILYSPVFKLYLSMAQIMFQTKLILKASIL